MFEYQLVPPESGELGTFQHEPQIHLKVDGFLRRQQRLAAGSIEAPEAQVPVHLCQHGFPDSAFRGFRRGPDRLLDPGQLQRLPAQRGLDRLQSQEQTLHVIALHVLQRQHLIGKLRPYRIEREVIQLGEDRVRRGEQLVGPVHVLFHEQPLIGNAQQIGHLGHLPFPARGRRLSGDSVDCFQHLPLRSFTRFLLFFGKRCQRPGLGCPHFFERLGLGFEPVLQLGKTVFQRSLGIQKNKKIVQVSRHTQAGKPGQETKQAQETASCPGFRPGYHGGSAGRCFAFPGSARHGAFPIAIPRLTGERPLRLAHQGWLLQRIESFRILRIVFRRTILVTGHC